MALDRDPTRRDRRRPSERGSVRLEVLGRESDRELIRTLVGRLAEDGPHADRLRTMIRDQTDTRAPTSSQIVQALRNSPLVGANIAAERSQDDDREIDL